MTLKRSFRRLALILGLAGLGWLGLLFLVQDRMIFFPRAYPVGGEPPAGYVPIPFSSADGAQVAWWVGPVQPRRWWIVFNGNGSLAWDWTLLPKTAADGSTGFLIVDWPGYGSCAGSPDQASIQRSVDGALAALAVRSGTAALPVPGVLGHSLGAAAALEFAVRHPVRGVVLAAPFTSLLAMARRQVGWPSCAVLRHRWDNSARLAELAARSDRPWVVIAHGDQDEIIPIAMGRSLADAWPGWVEFQLKAGASHVHVFGQDEAAFMALMRR